MDNLTEQKNIYSKKCLVWSVLISVIVCVLTTFVMIYYYSSYVTEITSVSQPYQNSDLTEQIADLKKELKMKEAQVTQYLNLYHDSNPLTNLSQALQQKAPFIDLEPQDGFFITTSVLSNSGQKIVYSEISECIKEDNKTYQANTENCHWDYRIYIKNLATGNIDLIYSILEQRIGGLLDNLFVPVARAGGCPHLPFPIGWSENDQKIILAMGNPTSCGSGGGVKYPYLTFDVQSKEMIDLATHSAVFIGNEKVVYVEESDKSLLRICAPVMQSNYGKIVIADIESGIVETLIEEINSYYYDLSISSDQKTLNYMVYGVKEGAGNCAEEDESRPRSAQSLSLGL